METLTSLVLKAQQSDNEAMLNLYQQFKPLLYKESMRFGTFDIDCFQELSERFVELILAFKVYS